MIRWSAASFLVVVVCLGTACGGGYPEPRNQLAESESAVRAAEVAGAQNSPQSAALMQEGENERAEWVLRRAQADADLALSLATEETQRKKAAEAKEALEQLQETLRKRGQAAP
jgi:hypothetical protein